MSLNTVIEVLRAYLKNERLCLCREVDTAFPLDGLTETLALQELIVVIHDAENWAENCEENWEEITQRIPLETMSDLMEASR